MATKNTGTPPRVAVRNHYAMVKTPSPTRSGSAKMTEPTNACAMSFVVYFVIRFVNASLLEHSIDEPDRLLDSPTFSRIVSGVFQLVQFVQQILDVRIRNVARGTARVRTGGHLSECGSVIDKSVGVGVSSRSSPA
ncbi:hypothetical protein ACFQS4_03260 [Saliphagus sp. GCM10025317]